MLKLAGCCGIFCTQGISFIFKYKPTLMIFLITVEHNADM